MQHLFVSYNLAVLAKEKGFNQQCLAFFNGTEKMLEPIDTDFVTFREIVEKLGDVLQHHCINS